MHLSEGEYIRISILIGLLGFSGCTTRKPSGEVFTSPSGQFLVEVQIGDNEEESNRHRIFFRLLDNDGDRLDIVDTRASAVMNYAVFWYSNNIVTLYSSDIGVYAWLVTEDEKLLPAHVDSKMKEKAEQIFKKKMGR